MIILAFLLRGNNFRIIASGIKIGLVIGTNKEIDRSPRSSGSTTRWLRSIFSCIIWFVLQWETCMRVGSCNWVFCRSPFPLIACNKCAKYRENSSPWRHKAWTGRLATWFFCFSHPSQLRIIKTYSPLMSRNRHLPAMKSLGWLVLYYDHSYMRDSQAWGC